MALTKVQTIGIETGISLTGVTTVTTLNASTDTLSVGGTVNFGGNVSIAGTLTYEDVTNIDAVGLITARSGVKFGESGTTIFGNSTGIGIGEASPTRKLVVAGDTNTVAVVRGATNGTSSLFLGDSDDEDIGALTYNHPSNYLSVTVNASERLRIASSGQVLLNGVTSTSTSGTSATDLLMSNGAAIRFRKGDDSAWINSVSLDSNNNLKLGSGGSTSEIHFGISGIGDQMYLDSSGRLLLGTTTEGAADADNLTIEDSGNCGITIRSGTSNAGAVYFSDATSGTGEYDGYINYNQSSRFLSFATATSEQMRIDSSGRLLLGTTSEGNSAGDDLTIATTGSTGMTIRSGTSGNGNVFFADGTSGDAAIDGFIQYQHANRSLKIGTAANERMRITNDGKFGFGTSSPSSLLHGEVSSGAATLTLKSTATSGEASVSITGENSSGTARTGIFKYDNADIFRLGTSSGIDFRFETNDTERARIDSDGNFLVGKTTLSDTAAGLSMRVGGVIAFEATVAAGAAHCMMLNRQGDDGAFVKFRQANTLEGSITVSGSTVSYNGGHLARWSQLADGAARTEILRGSVLSNLNEMCEWGEEENEQLNRMKISDVEGDRNVAGVFQAWDDNDDTYTNDFYCAMTGDFIIRIAQGTTVARGDLLMSAGDGTAKPQDDDIVRSKTIAKVTSTTVSTTYSDGSYCVPCVLMAC